MPCLQFRFGSIVPKNTNKPERYVTANKMGLFYSKPTLPSLPDFCSSFSKGKNQLNYVNALFRTKKKCFSNIRKLLKTLFLWKINSRQIHKTCENLILSR